MPLTPVKRDVQWHTALSVLVVVLLAGTPLSTPVLAGPNGTTSLGEVINARSTGGTIPSQNGEASIRWSNTVGGDTQYYDTGSTVRTVVDTGYDLRSNLNQKYPVEGDREVDVGDSVVYTFQVRNRGNNDRPVPITLNLRTDSGASSSFKQELFQETSGDSNFDTGADARITSAVGSDSDLLFSEDESETFYAVITVRDTADDGDTLGNSLFVTDNAPVSNGSSFSGDQWENGTVIASGDTDANDTQNIYFRTTVRGPKLSISKQYQLLSGGARPGDTVQFTITVENLGGDTAHEVTAMDAVPDSTTLVDTGTPGDTNDDAILVAPHDTDLQNVFTVHQDTDLTGTSYDDSTRAEDTRRLKFDLPKLGPQRGTNETRKVRFWVTID